MYFFISCTFWCLTLGKTKIESRKNVVLTFRVDKFLPGLQALKKGVF